MKIRVQSEEYIKKWLLDNNFKEREGSWYSERTQHKFWADMFKDCDQEINVQPKRDASLYDYINENPSFYSWLKEWLILDEVKKKGIKIIGDGTAHGTKIFDENDNEIKNVTNIKLDMSIEGTFVDITQSYTKVEINLEVKN